MNEPSIAVSRINRLAKILVINNIEIKYSPMGFWYFSKFAKDVPKRAFDNWLDAVVCATKPYLGE